MTKLEPLECYSRFDASLLHSQLQYPESCAPSQGLDRIDLPVHRGPLLKLSSQLVHDIELQPLLGQPKELDIELADWIACGQRHMAAGPIRQQTERANLLVRTTQHSEKPLHIGCRYRFSSVHRAVDHTNVDGIEQQWLSAMATDLHLDLCTLLSIHGMQRQEKPQERPAEKQQGIACAKACSRRIRLRSGESSGQCLGIKDDLAATSLSN